ncbi:unnamed protein product [Rotaria magnacalcarata]|uniref:Uncharacterized protein n=1 Tax=Rotaria magnacalcarata TaxID=392030 RepID=A0A8S2UVF0_9BILA|nr:unnamed protein product [Rotaria magnacalcarata]
MKSKDIQKVVLRMTDDDRRSARKLASPLGVSRGTIGRTIHDDLHLHAYHITIQPNLKDEHKQERISFAYWVRKSGETLTYENYIEIVLPHALLEG